MSPRQPKSTRLKALVDSRQWPLCDELMEEVAAATSRTCLISFSLGRDSLALWIKLREHFERIVPIYGYLVPDLEFVQRSVEQYEDFFQTRIIQVPTPWFPSALRKGLWQPPHRNEAVEQLTLQEYEWDDIFNDVRIDEGLPEDTVVFDGVRAAESIRRNMAIRKHGPITWNRHKAHGIWNYRRADCMRVITDAGAKLPIDYEWFGRSFDGLWAELAVPLEHYAPEDYRRCCEWFPLLPAERVRAELTYGAWKDDYA